MSCDVTHHPILFTIEDLYTGKMLLVLPHKYFFFFTSSV